MGVVLVLAAAGAAWWLRQSPAPSPGVANPPGTVLTPITADSGLSYSPALSPDGKLLAYASDRSGEGSLDIWVQQVGGGEPVRLTNHKADDYEPSFSPVAIRLKQVRRRRRVIVERQRARLLRRHRGAHDVEQIVDRQPRTFPVAAKRIADQCPGASPGESGAVTRGARLLVDDLAPCRLVSREGAFTGSGLRSGTL